MMTSARAIPDFFPEETQEQKSKPRPLIALLIIEA